jgi:hypothetical protein
MLSTNPIAKLGKGKYYLMFDLNICLAKLDVREEEVNSFLERRKGPRKKINKESRNGNYVCLAA